jgi:putative DNA primase/helicase
MSRTALLEAALALAARGLPVFPLHYPNHRDGRAWCSCGAPDCGNIGKHPYARLAPRGFTDATADRETVERWWGSTECNIGMPTGAASGLVVLDVDPRHGGDDSLAALERRHGALPATWRFLTGGGGEHILFRHPGVAIRNTAGKLGDGLDIRGDGGYIVVPPSLHASGRRYAISVDHHPDEVALADMPEWLRGLLCARPMASPATMPESWRRLVRDGVGEGRRNDAIARLAGLLLRKGIDPYVTLDLARTWNAVRCRPPLEDAEVVAIVNSIAGREAESRERRYGR